MRFARMLYLSFQGVSCLTSPTIAHRTFQMLICYILPDGRKTEDIRLVSLHFLDLRKYLQLMHFYRWRKINIHFRETASVEKSQNFASSFLSARLLVIHNSECSCEHYVAETTRRKDILHPLLNILMM